MGQKADMLRELAVKVVVFDSIGNGLEIVDRTAGVHLLRGELMLVHFEYFVLKLCR